MKNTFNLVNYTPHIVQLAKVADVSVEKALNYFIVNLTTMKEHYEGCPELNYHVLGQQWNSLLSPEKVAQKREALARIAKYNKGVRV